MVNIYKKSYGCHFIYEISHGKREREERMKVTLRGFHLMRKGFCDLKIFESEWNDEETLSTHSFYSSLDNITAIIFQLTRFLSSL